MKTLGISLWEGQVRAGGNAQTVMRDARVPSRRSVRDQFTHDYARFAATCRAVDEPGVAIVAVEERTGRAAGIVKLHARVGRPVAAIVGRHDQCDLFLRGHDGLALRQFAVLLAPVASWEPGAAKVSYRVIDLRTTDGMMDEDGRLLRGVRAEGPSILRCAGYTFFILTLGDPTDWPESASDAWAMLPERVYFDELDNPAAGSLPALRLPRRDVRQSYVFRTLGPHDTAVSQVVNATAQIGEGTDFAGRLELAGPTRGITINVTHDALRDGLLLGRYGRCDVSEVIDDPSLSRVHALLIHEQDRLLVIDTASYNGTRLVGEPRARVVEIDRDLELQLGKKTRLRWRWLG